MGYTDRERITVLAQTDEQSPRTLMTEEGHLPQTDVTPGYNAEDALRILGEKALGRGYHLLVKDVHPGNPNGRLFETDPVHPDAIPNTGFRWQRTDAS